MSKSNAPATPRLLDRLRACALDRFARKEPGERFAGWARRFILFHQKRHPAEMGTSERDTAMRTILVLHERQSPDAKGLEPNNATRR
jgi:hypothetical protein